MNRLDDFVHAPNDYYERIEQCQTSLTNRMKKELGKIGKTVMEKLVE
jgi:hypothetical protein